MTFSRMSRRRLLSWAIAAAVSCSAFVSDLVADSPATQPANGNTLSVGVPDGGEPVDAKLDQVAKWFNQLDAADPPVRDAAYNKLMSLKATDLDALKQAVKSSMPLRPEQESALPGIVKQVYLSGMDYDGDASQGFLGVSLLDRDLTQQPPNPPEGVPHVGLVVAHCMPGFCAARLLREGDVILNIAERPDVKVEGFQDFATTVRGFNAGQVIHLNVLRQGQVIRVPISLDARPVELDGQNAGVIEDMQERRRTAADEYWSRAFAPLFKNRTS